MALKLLVAYQSAGDFKSHLFEHAERGALLLPLRDVPEEMHQYEPVEIAVRIDEDEAVMQAEVLQVFPGNGLVVRLTVVDEAAARVADAAVADAPLPPLVTRYEESPAEEPEEQEAPKRKRGSPAGMGPTSWSIEKLLAEWDRLSMAEKVRVARFGKRPARMMILKGPDKTLHNHILNNPTITPEEVAVMASMAGLDPAVLRRIAGSAEWTRHNSVVRNLVCNPKMTLPIVSRLLKHLPNDELSRLARTGKVRAAIKKVIIKKISGGK